MPATNCNSDQCTYALTQRRRRHGNPLPGPRQVESHGREQVVFAFWKETIGGLGADRRHEPPCTHLLHDSHETRPIDTSKSTAIRMVTAAARRCFTSHPPRAQRPPPTPHIGAPRCSG
eukprot:341135-Prymnesium_polylepis.2